MRQFFIFLLLTLHSFMQFAQSDSLHQSAWKALHEWEIGDDEIWTTDVLGNVLLTKKNLIQKYDSAGVLKYSQSIRSFGRLQDIQAVNSMKIVAFSEEQQTICLLDNTLTLSENCLELADFNIGNAFKYLWRAGLKDEAKTIQDLEKAIFYIKDEINRLEGKYVN